MQDGTRLAAVDLGSNSFRLEIGRLDLGLIQRTEYLRETVRLGAGLDAQGLLSPQAMQRGWACLDRFGKRLAGFKKGQVRAVATQTLREACNRDEFLGRACELLGFPIEVIDGHEEASLAYQGAVHLLPPGDERRLVVDIGGRSTELVTGRGLSVRDMASWPLGSVNWSLRYFAQGQFTQRAFETAERAAQAALHSALPRFGPDHWDRACGGSGTIHAVAQALTALGAPPGRIFRQDLDGLLERLLQAGSASRLTMEGLNPDHRAVIGGGLSMLRAVFGLLDIREMQVCQGALRHGVLQGLLARNHHGDALGARPTA